MPETPFLASLHGIYGFDSQSAADSHSQQQLSTSFLVSRITAAGGTLQALTVKEFQFAPGVQRGAGGKFSLKAVVPIRNAVPAHATGQWLHPKPVARPACLHGPPCPLQRLGCLYPSPSMRQNPPLENTRIGSVCPGHLAPQPVVCQHFRKPPKVAGGLFKGTNQSNGYLRKLAMKSLKACGVVLADGANFSAHTKHPSITVCYRTWRRIHLSMRQWTTQSCQVASLLGSRRSYSVLTTA